MNEPRSPVAPEKMQLVRYEMLLDRVRKLAGIRDIQRRELPELAAFVEAAADWQLHADSAQVFRGRVFEPVERWKATSILQILWGEDGRAPHIQAAEFASSGDRLAIWLAGAPAKLAFDPELFGEKGGKLSRHCFVPGGHSLDGNASAADAGGEGRERLDERCFANGAGEVIHDEVSVAGVATATVGDGPGTVTASEPGARA